MGSFYIQPGILKVEIFSLLHFLFTFAPVRSTGWLFHVVFKVLRQQKQLYFLENLLIRSRIILETGIIDKAKAFNSFLTKVSSHRNQFNDLQRQSMYWFLFDRDIRHERVKNVPRQAVMNLQLRDFGAVQVSNILLGDLHFDPQTQIRYFLKIL